LGFEPAKLSYQVGPAEAAGWRGRRADVTGLYWLGARYYDAAAGRFVSPDPLGHAASLSLYDYAGNDPVNGMDPDGRLAKQQLQDRTIGLFYESVGAAENLRDSITGLYNVARHPIQTAQGLWSAVTHPGQTYDAITDAIGDSIYRYGEASQGRGDDPYYHHRINGAIKLEVALAVLTAGAAEAKHLRWADDVADAGRLARGVDDLAAKTPLALPAPAQPRALLPGVSGTADDIVVIGTRADTLAAEGWAGHKVSNIQNWSIPANDAFIQAAIQQRQTFYLASPINYKTLWNPGRNSMTVFGRELGQVFQAGYKQVGNNLVPPPLP
jgi:RHS repeat-associated protein